MSNTSMTVCDRERTASLLDFRELVDAIATAAAEREAGSILSPERMVVPLGAGGVLLSMPATAKDIGIHKLVNVQLRNRQRQLPTIHGAVTVCDTDTGRILCLLDGPEVTGRRTAAATMLAVRIFSQNEPGRILLIGTGAQATFHLRAIAALYPQCNVMVRGRHQQATEEFCARSRDLHANLEPCGASLPEADVVITVTTSTQPVFDEPARVGRLVIGVGAFRLEMAEIGAVTLGGSDIYADDPAGARHEAGDLLRAGVDWTRVKSLAAALRGPVDRSRPTVFKSVGSAAWDLAAARVALRSLGER